MNYKWTKDEMNDYVTSVGDPEKNIPIVNGRVIYCPIVKPFKFKGWTTNARWLLLVNGHFYGFWKSLKEAKARFDRDCVPKGNCPECGQPNGSLNCCVNDEDLNK